MALPYSSWGGDAGVETRGNVKIHNLGYLKNQNDMAEAYSAADFYLHAAHGENFPTTILEALACGVPVVATAVGGIPEQVLTCLDESGGLVRGKVPMATGALVAPKDSQAMAQAVATINADEPARLQLAANARTLAVDRFDRRRQIRDTLDWYRKCIPLWQEHRGNVVQRDS